MCAPWRAELPSETVLMFCKLCWGSGNICVLCVSVAVGSLGVSLQQLVHLVIVHGTWHTVRLGEVCWLMQNVKYSGLQKVKVTECVCVCVLCVWVCDFYVCEAKFDTFFCTFWNRSFVTGYCTVTNTDTLAQAAVLSETQTVMQFLIQLLFTSVIQSQLQLFGSSVILSSSEDRNRIHYDVLWFSVDRLGRVYTSFFMFCSSVPRQFVLLFTHSAI